MFYASLSLFSSSLSSFMTYIGMQDLFNQKIIEATANFGFLKVFESSQKRKERKYYTCQDVMREKQV